MQFNDELAGGIVLVRPALQSPDYVAGTTGWAVFIDGSAEFNDVVVRGTLESANYVPGSAGWHLDQAGSAEFNDVTIRGGSVVGGEALYYDGTPAAGNLVLSISAPGGTDPFGNPYVGGLGIYDPDGSQLQLESGAGASAYWTPQDKVGVTWVPGVITTTVGASNRGGLMLSSAATSVHTEKAAISLFGGSPTTSDTSVLFGADRVNFSGNVEVTGEITSYSSWGTFVPQWNNVGTATFSTNVGWWKRFDDIYVWEIYAVASAAGSGTTTVTISNLPFNPFRAGAGAGTTRQRVGAYLAGVSAGTNSSVSGSFSAVVNAGGASNTIDSLRGPTDINFRGEQISGSFIATIQGWMRST